MHRWFAAFCCFACLSFATPAQVQNGHNSAQSAPADAKPAATELPKLEKFDPSIVDKTRNACVDFYQHTCGNWLAAHPITPDMAENSTVHPLFLYNQTILRNALEAAAADKQATGSERQIGDFWQSCMDETARNANGKAWLQPALNTIASLKSSRDLPRVLAYLHLNFPAAWQMWNDDDNYTKAPLFGFGPAQDLEDASKVVAGVDQGGMALPSLDYYLDSSEHSKELRAKYVQHIQKMFELAGDASDKAAAEARTVMEIETALAKASMDNVTRRDPQKIYNKRTLQQLKAAVPDFGWDQYLQLMGAPSVPFYIVSQPPFLDAVEQQIKTRSPQEWQAYLRWWAIHRGASYTSHDFEQANFDFFGTTLYGIPQMLPQWRRCVGSTDHFLGEALGQAYLNIAFPPESKQRANQLVDQIRAALVEEIQQLDWMSDATKKQALIKQSATLQKIGYPNTWRDYSSVKLVPNNYLANMNAANAFEAHRQVGKIGKPVDRNEWGMTPATINAYEDPQMNTINFPAGIMQLPMFSGTQDDASNFGAIGMVIGHETIHGFDDQGRKFDAHGNLRDWWTPEDAKNFDERAECVQKQFDSYEVEDGLHENGKLVLGESIADLGGLTIAYNALEKDLEGKPRPLIGGYTPEQRFFLSYEQLWAANDRPEFERLMVNTNPHALDRFRAIAAPTNMPAFYKAFDCQEGDAMVRPSEIRCQIW